MTEFDKQMTPKEQFLRDFKKLYDKYHCSVWFNVNSNKKAESITDFAIFTDREYGSQKINVKEILHYMWPEDNRYL